MSTRQKPQADFSDLGAEPISHAPAATLAGVTNQLPKQGSTSDFSDLGAEPIEPGLQSGNPIGSIGKGTLAALLGGTNEQTLGLSGRILPQQQQKLAQDYPNATTAGRIGSYFVPGMDEVGPAARIASGIGEGIEGGANAIKSLIPNTSATGGALTTVTNLLKTPVTMGATSAGLKAANDIASGKVPGQDVGDAAQVALNPGALALGYTGSALGGVSRGTELPQKVYQTSGLLAGTESGKASEQASALMNAGVRTPFLQNLMDLVSGRKPGGIAARVQNAADEAGTSRMAVISDAQKTGPSTPVQAVTNNLREKAAMVSNPAPYLNLAESIENSVRGIGVDPITLQPAHKSLSPMGLEELLQNAKSRLRADKTATGASDIFADPINASALDAQKQLINGGTKAQYGQIDATFGEGSPQANKFADANMLSGATSDAARNLGDINQSPGAQTGHGITPMSAIERSLRKYALVPAATNAGSGLNYLTNNMPYNSAGIVGIMNQIATQRAKENAQ